MRLDTFHPPAHPRSSTSPSSRLQSLKPALRAITDNMLFTPVIAVLSLLTITDAAPVSDPGLVDGVLGRALTGTVSSVVGLVPALRKSRHAL